MLSIFSCTFWSSVCLLWRNARLGLLPSSLIGLFGFLIWNCMSYLCNWEVDPLSAASFVIIFSRSVSCRFVSFMISFYGQKLLNLVPIVYFCFYFHYSKRWVQKDFAVIYVKERSVFSSRSFIVYSLTFGSLIRFEFIFVCSVRECSNFILLLAAVHFPQHHFLKRLSFLHCIFLPLS